MGWVDLLQADAVTAIFVDHTYPCAFLFSIHYIEGNRLVTLGVWDYASFMWIQVVNGFSKGSVAPIGKAQSRAVWQKIPRIAAASGAS